MISLNIAFFNVLELVIECRSYSVRQLLQLKLCRLANIWPKNVKNRSKIQHHDLILKQSADSKTSTVSLRQEVLEIEGIALAASLTAACMKKSAFKRHFGLRPTLTTCKAIFVHRGRIRQRREMPINFISSGVW